MGVVFCPSLQNVKNVACCKAELFSDKTYSLLYLFQNDLKWIRYLKRETGLPVMAGNALMKLFPGEVMSHKEIDYGIIGPAHRSLPELLEALSGGKDPGGIDGICFRKADRTIINRPSSLKEDFAALPFPARHLLENSRYSTIFSQRKNFTIMMASQGCPCNCVFCDTAGLPYSPRPSEDVLKEIGECYRRYHIREIEFFDPVFTLQKKSVIALCKGIIEKRFSLSWACRTRVDLVDDELLAWMSRAGCRRIYYGIESGAPDLLQRAGKNINLLQIGEAVRLTRKHKIKALGFFIMGVPGETKTTIKRTREYALSLDLDYAHFQKIVPKPSTPLYEEVKRKLGYDYWKEYVLGNTRENRLPAPWCDLSGREIEQAAVTALRRFYFRPGRIFRMLAGLRSLEELFRYIRSAIGLWTTRSDLD